MKRSLLKEGLSVKVGVVAVMLCGGVFIASAALAAPTPSPVVVTVTPVAGSLLQGIETFTITVTVNGNPLVQGKNKNIWVYLYNAAPPQKQQGMSVDLSSGSGTFTVDTTKLANGNAWLDVGRVFDGAGNPASSGDNYFKNYDIENNLIASCPAGTIADLVETDNVNANSFVPTTSSNSLTNGTTYLLVSSGTWQNNNLNVADTAFASVDNWTTQMQGYNISPFLLGSGEFQLQVDGAFVNWGAYQPTHQYAYLYTGTGNPVGLMVFDGDSTASPAVPNTGWYGDNVGNLTVSIYSCDANQVQV